MTDALVDYLASFDIRRLSTDELNTELEYAQRELADPDTHDGYREYQTKRVEALSTEMRRRQHLGVTVKGNGITSEFIQDLKRRVDIRDIFNDVLKILVIPSGTGRERSLAQHAATDIRAELSTFRSSAISVFNAVALTMFTTA